MLRRSQARSGRPGLRYERAHLGPESVHPNTGRDPSKIYVMDKKGAMGTKGPFHEAMAYVTTVPGVQAEHC